LGASKQHVFGLILKQGMRITAFGLLLGAVGALAVGWMLTPMLAGVAPIDLVTLTIAAAALLLVALLACCIPARKAFRLDPIVAVRHE